MDKILKNIFVLDMTEGVAGPGAASLLGDMGATVVKIEKPEGDWGRGFEDPMQPHFVANNRNKKDLCIDLLKEEAKTVLNRLIGRSDIVLSNYRKGVVERLGAGYEACREIKPDIIYCTISAFGQAGAYSGLPASDTGIQAMSGIMDFTGEPEGPPLRVNFPLVDIYSASLAVQGILLALYRRQQGKSGAKIDISLLNAAMFLQAMPFTSYLMTGRLSQRSGNQNPLHSPAGAFRTKDKKYLTVAILRESQWERFCQALEIVQIAKEERFRTDSLRIKNRAALNEILAPRFLRKTRDEWMRLFREADILCSPVNTHADLLDDSALAESIPFWNFHRVGKEIRMMGNPIEMNGEFIRLDLPAPLKGEHTIEILQDLGFSAADIQTMLSQKIVYGVSGP